MPPLSIGGNLVPLCHSQFTYFTFGSTYNTKSDLLGIEVKSEGRIDDHQYDEYLYPSHLDCRCGDDSIRNAVRRFQALS